MNALPAACGTKPVDSRAPVGALSDVGLVEDLRRGKDDGELAALRAAAAATDAAFAALGRLLEGAETEDDLAWGLVAEMRRQGGKRADWEAIVAAGAAASVPHYETGRAPLGRGLLLLDYGCVVDGYHSDMSRTVWLDGAPDPVLERVFRVVLEAEQAGVAAARPGVSGHDVDEAVRAVLRREGYEEQFLHSTGHGVGLEIHEAPWLRRGNEDPLRVGDVVTVRGTVSGPGFTQYFLEYAPSPVSASGPWLPIAGPFTTPVEAGDLGTWDLGTLVDGTYVLRVRAHTTTGDVFDDRITVVVDHVILASPVLEDIVGAGGAPVEIRGTAAGAGFQRFQLEYRRIGPDLVEGPWTTAGMTLAGDGAAPVSADVLATLDPAALPGGSDIDLRLSVDTGRATGPIVEEMRHVVVDRTLEPGWPRRIPGLPNAYPRPKHHVVIADLDADGTKEILAAWGDLVFVFRHDGSNFPGWPQSTSSPGSEDSYVDTAPTAADLDGDRRLEVVAANHEAIFIWHHDGTPMAPWPMVVEDPIPPYGSYTAGGDIVLTDLDGDGARDLVFRLGRSLTAIRVSDGSTLAGFPVQKDCVLLEPACFEGAVAVGDTTGDGRKEIAIIENTGHALGRQYLHLYDDHGRLMPGFPVTMTYRQSYGDVSGFGVPVLADVDGDGALDIAINTDKAKSLLIYSSAGKKLRFLPRKLPDHRSHAGSGIGTFRSSQEPLSAGDLDGDGRAEILVGSDFPATLRRRNSWTFLLPPYSGTDYLSAVTMAGAPLAGWPVAFDYRRADKAHGAGTAVVGDIDGDGRQDVVTGTGTCQYWGGYSDLTLHRCYSIYAFRTDGTLLPGFPKAVPTPSPQLGNSVAIGDLDGDGLKEIVFLDYNGNVIVWTVPGTPGPERMQWPMIRHDPAGTSALVANP